MLNPQELGNKIRLLRNKSGKSQEQLGAALDRSHAAISDIERGITNLSVSDLSKIAQFFGVSVNEILDEAPTTQSVIHFRDGKDITLQQTQEANKEIENMQKAALDLAQNPDKSIQDL
jgi:transcriptional regulator with XRE-family HTH domain